MRLRVARMDEFTTRYDTATAWTRMILALSVVVFGIMAAPARTDQPDTSKKASDKANSESSKPKLGLLVNDAEAQEGYTLLAPPIPPTPT